jgi:hypothetical protein
MKMCWSEENVNSQLLEPFRSIVFTEACPQFSHPSHDPGEINGW